MSIGTLRIGWNGFESKKYLKFKNDRIDDQPEARENFVRAGLEDSGLDISKNGVPTVMGYLTL